MDIFLTVEGAERKLVPIDVINGEYSAHDADAVPLEIKDIDGKAKMNSINRFAETDLLEEILIDFLNAISPKYKMVNTKKWS